MYNFFDFIRPGLTCKLSFFSLYFNYTEIVQEKEGELKKNYICNLCNGMCIILTEEIQE